MPALAAAVRAAGSSPRTFCTRAKGELVRVTQRPIGERQHFASPGSVQSAQGLSTCLPGRCMYTVHVTLRFEWDPAKSASNRKKHGVSFEEAKSAFSDEHGRLLDDPDHSEDEQRVILLGMSSALRILVVCHCYREANSTIRIISARKANRAEQRQYESR